MFKRLLAVNLICNNLNFKRIDFNKLPDCATTLATVQFCSQKMVRLNIKTCEKAQLSDFM